MRSAVQLQHALGEEIRRLRQARVLTQEALAHDSGIHTNALGRLERGESDSRVVTLFKVAIGLKMPLEEIIAGVKRR